MLKLTNNSVFLIKNSSQKKNLSAINIITKISIELCIAYTVNFKGQFNCSLFMPYLNYCSFLSPSVSGYSLILPS